MAKLMIKNIGTLVSGDISNPISNADTLLIEGGVIQGIGKEKDLDLKGVDEVMDVGGMTVTPGLIDSHCHPVPLSYGMRDGFGASTFIKVCQNTPKLCWGDEWPTLSSGGHKR